MAKKIVPLSLQQGSASRPQRQPARPARRNPSVAVDLPVRDNPSSILDDVIPIVILGGLGLFLLSRMNPLGGIGDALGTAGRGVGDALGNVGSGVGSTAGNVGSGVGSAMGNIGSGVGGALGNIGSGIGSGLGSLGSGIGGVLGGGGGQIITDRYGNQFVMLPGGQELRDLSSGIVYPAAAILDPRYDTRE